MLFKYKHTFLSFLPLFLFYFIYVCILIFYYWFFSCSGMFQDVPERAVPKSGTGKQGREFGDVGRRNSRCGTREVTSET